MNVFYYTLITLLYFFISVVISTTTAEAQTASPNTATESTEPTFAEKYALTLKDYDSLFKALDLRFVSIQSSDIQTHIVDESGNIKKLGLGSVILLDISGGRYVLTFYPRGCKTKLAPLPLAKDPNVIIRAFKRDCDFSSSIVDKGTIKVTDAYAEADDIQSVVIELVSDNTAIPAPKMKFVFESYLYAGENEAAQEITFFIEDVVSIENPDENNWIEVRATHKQPLSETQKKAIGAAPADIP